MRNISWLIPVTILASCYGPKQAKKQVDRAILEQPGVAAAELRKAFPCVIINSDTTTITKDSLVYVDCPDSTIITEVWHDTLNQRDTITNRTVRVVRVPVHLPVKTQVVTKYIKDGADEAVIKGLHEQLNAITLKNSQNKGRGDKWFWIAMGLLALHGVWIFLKLKSFNLKS